MCCNSWGRTSYDGDLSLPLVLALGSPIFPSGCEGKLGVAIAHERLPELPVIPREKPHTGATARENPRDATVIARLGTSFPA